MIQRDRKSTIPPCACCGKASELDCWQYRLCVECWKDWHKNVGPPPSHYEIPTVTVENGERVVMFKTSLEQSARNWSEATEKWLKQAKARAA